MRAFLFDNEKRAAALVCLFSFLTGLLWVLTKGQSINGDEAVIGLMAMKISQGKDFPFFFWKAHYSGPIASYLAAPLHWLWKPSGMLLHAVVVPFHMSYCCGIYLLARRWLNGEKALMCGLLAALPFQVFPYSALGGYTESMAFIPWIILLSLGAIHPTEKPGDAKRRLFCAGLLSGLALWVFPVSVPTVTIAFIFLLPRAGKRYVLWSVLGAFSTLLPTIIYNLIHPGASLLRLLSRPVGIQKQTLLQSIGNEGSLAPIADAISHWASASYKSLLSLPEFTLTLFGLGHDGSLWTSMAGSVGLAGFVLGVVLCARAKERTRHIPHALFLQVVLTYAFLVIFGMDRYRYLIPVLVMVPVGIALLIDNLSKFFQGKGRWSILFVFLALNIFSNYPQHASKSPRMEDLITFLRQKGLVHGYADYFLAYPLDYISNENLIYTPAFHNPESDRYPEYTRLVSAAEASTYIFSEPSAADSFEHLLSQRRISFTRTSFGPYFLFQVRNKGIVFRESQRK